MKEENINQWDRDLDRYLRACDYVMETLLGETRSGHKETLGKTLKQIFHNQVNIYDGVDPIKLKSLCDYVDSKYDDLFVKEI